MMASWQWNYITGHFWGDSTGDKGDKSPVVGSFGKFFIIVQTVCRTDSHIAGNLTWHDPHVTSW